jgi:hypothetical protein
MQTPRLIQPNLTPSQNTHLDRQQLSYCVSLIENGANPEALAVRITAFSHRGPANHASYRAPFDVCVDPEAVCASVGVRC